VTSTLLPSLAASALHANDTTIASRRAIPAQLVFPRKRLRRTGAGLRSPLRAVAPRNTPYLCIGALSITGRVSAAFLDCACLQLTRSEIQRSIATGTAARDERSATASLLQLLLQAAYRKAYKYLIGSARCRRALPPASEEQSLTSSGSSQAPARNV
jgi:hypothetical protein